MKVEDIFNKKLKVNEEDSLCLYPFFNLMVSADGRYKPCCKWSEVLSHRGEELKAPKHDMQDAWNSDELAQLRKDLLAGKKPLKCEVCWNEEKSGIKSMRYDSFDYGLRKNILSSPSKPSRLDIYPSNVCNLKCRICSPEYSNKWIQEAKETMGAEAEMHLNLTDENMALIEEWLPNIVELGLFGGEPLFMKECIGLLELCVEKGFSKNITLLINTNGTMYSQKLMNVFKSFKKVLLNFSIDDIEERFEYQRKGAKWLNVVENLKQYTLQGGYTMHDQIEYKMCCTVSSFNIYYLPEYFKWVGETFPGMQVYLNFLHGPYSLSAKNLPQAVKQQVIDKLNNHRDEFSLNFEEKQTRTIENVQDFILLKPNIPFDQFFIEVDRGDKYRKENFEEVFPEFAALIMDYKN